MSNTNSRNIFSKFLLLPLLSISISAQAFQMAPTPSPKVNNSTENSQKIDNTGRASSTDKTTSAVQDRVIKQVTAELVEDDSCVDCSSAQLLQASGFPAYALFAIGGAALTPFLVNSFVNNGPKGSTADVSPS